MWIVLLRTKDVVTDAVKRIKAEKESGHKLNVLRTDNGGELTVFTHAGLSYLK